MLIEIALLIMLLLTFCCAENIPLFLICSGITATLFLIASIREAKK